jgi:hypothetical protein
MADPSRRAQENRAKREAWQCPRKTGGDSARLADDDAGWAEAWVLAGALVPEPRASSAAARTPFVTRPGRTAEEAMAMKGAIVAVENIQWVFRRGGQARPSRTTAIFELGCRRRHGAAPAGRLRRRRGRRRLVTQGYRVLLTVVFGSMRKAVGGCALWRGGVPEDGFATSEMLRLCISADKRITYHRIVFSVTTTACGGTGDRRLESGRARSLPHPEFRS